MKLGLLIAARQILQKVNQSLELDIDRAYELRKAVKKIEKETEIFASMQDDFIRKNSEDGQLIPGRDDRALVQLQLMINQLSNKDVDLEVPTILTRKDFNKTTVATIELLEEIGLLEKEKTEEEKVEEQKDDTDGSKRKPKITGRKNE